MIIQNEIETLLRQHFEVQLLDLLNESHMHSVPPGSETHFKLTLVSQDFFGLGKVVRHQRIYGLVRPLMDAGLHALALHLFTPAEWQEKSGQVPASPQCMGGSKTAHEAQG